MASPNHLKRLVMPRSWPLPRKTSIWVSKPKPGAHSLERGMPLNMIIRDVLGLANTNREVRAILNQGLVKVDGRVCRETRRSVGLMDVLTLGEDNYRCVLDHKGRLRYRPIPASDAAWKVCRVEGKTTVKGGKTQINLHDGRNILVDDAAQYATHDAVRISLPDQEVLEHIVFAEGTRCFLIGQFDPLNDALVKIHNAEQAGKMTVDLSPASKLLGNVLSIMQKAGYVGEYEREEDGRGGQACAVGGRPSRVPAPFRR